LYPLQFPGIPGGDHPSGAPGIFAPGRLIYHHASPTESSIYSISKSSSDTVLSVASVFV
jgi:hypothetical protein